MLGLLDIEGNLYLTLLINNSMYIIFTGKCIGVILVTFLLLTVPGDKNSTSPLVITSEIQKERLILPKALVLQDECFGKNYLRKSYYIYLPYVLYCISF